MYPYNYYPPQYGGSPRRQKIKGLTSVEDVKGWFMGNNTEGENPYWTLYDGHSADTAKRTAFNLKESDPEKSWEILEEAIDRYPAGNFYLKVRGKASNAGQSGYGTAITLLESAPRGIHGIGQVPPPWAMQPQESREEIERRVRYEVETQHEIAGLKAALEEKTRAEASLLDRIAGFFQTEQGARLGEVFLTRFMPAAPMQPATVGIQGVEDAPAPEGFAYNEGRLIAALDRIRAVFGDDGFHDNLDKLAGFIEENKAVAKQMLGK